MNIKRLNEELELLLEVNNVKIGSLTLIPHGENATKYYKNAVEYFKRNVDKVSVGFINLSMAELGLGNDKQSVGYEFKK